MLIRKIFKLPKMLGVIEQMRDNHEDIENLEQAAVDCLLAKSRKELGVNSDFCVDFIASEIHRKATELVRNYADPDGVRNDDIQYMGGNGSHDVWHAFYNRVAEVKDFTSREVNRNSVCKLGLCVLIFYRYPRNLQLKHGATQRSLRLSYE